MSTIYLWAALTSKISPYTILHPPAQQKILEKIFDNFLDMALLNAFILYKNNTDNPLDRYNFMVDIVESLVEDEIVDAPEPHPGPAGDTHNLMRRPESVCAFV